MAGIFEAESDVVGILEKSGDPWLIHSIPIKITFAGKIYW
jgi:hypothetical protein